MQTLGTYTLLTAVGVGSTGTVWRAQQADLNRIVAVKVLSPQAHSDRLSAEARILAGLDHPNIVRVFDFAEAGTDSPDSPAWLAEEWVDGQRLDELITDLTDPLTAEQALGVIRGALLGLAHAHQHGIVHGDVAASNILVDTTGNSRLIDFGLASPAGAPGAVGTPAFISPEAARGQPVTPASDVYSAAAVLHFLLTGQPPFGQGDPATLIERHLMQPPPRLTDHGERLADLVARALAKDPVARPADAGAFLAELEEAARERYGAGWLARASVGGLAAAPAVAAAVETAVGGAGASAVPAAAAAIATGVSADTDRAAKTRFPRKTFAGVGAAVVVAGIVIAVVATSGGNDKTTASVTPVSGAGGNMPASSGPPVDPAKSAAAASASPESVPAAAAQRLAGRYRVTTKVVASTIDVEPAGTVKPTVTWTISGDCSAAPCHLAINSSSGKHFNALFDGTTMAFRQEVSQRKPCIDETTRQPVAGTSFLNTDVVVYRFRVTGLGEGQTPALSGNGDAVQTYSDPQGACDINPPGTEKIVLTGTRI